MLEIIINDLDLDSQDLLDRTKAVKDLTKKELIFDHALLHRYFKLVSSGEKVKNWNMEDIANQHQLIVDEFKKRKIDHNISDDLDKKSIKELMKLKESALQFSQVLEIKEQLPDDILVKKNFLSIVGSILTSDKPNDIDLVYKSSSFDESLVKNFDSTLKTLSIPSSQIPTEHIFSEDGPQGISFSLYDLHLVKSKEDEVDFDYEIYLNQPIQREDQIPLTNTPASTKTIRRMKRGYLQPEIDRRGIEIQLMRNPEEVLIFSEGEMISAPEVMEDLSKINDPVNLFLLGWYLSSGEVVLTDILHWRNTQLVNLPYSQRVTFLKKLKLEDKDLSHLKLIPSILIDSDTTDEEISQEMSNLRDEWGNFFIIRSLDDLYQDEIIVERLQLQEGK